MLVIFCSKSAKKEVPSHYIIITCTQSSSRSRPLPLSHLCKYRLSTSALELCAPYIIISFFALQSSSSSSIFVQLMILTPYLTMETALEPMAEIIFPPFNFDFSIFLTLLRYSFFIWSFISSCFTPSASKILRCFYLPSSIFFIIFPSGILIPSLLTFWDAVSDYL